MSANPRVVKGDNVDGNSQSGSVVITDGEPKLSNLFEAKTLGAQLKREEND